MSHMTCTFSYPTMLQVLFYTSETNMEKHVICHMMQHSKGVMGTQYTTDVLVMKFIALPGQQNKEWHKECNQKCWGETETGQAYYKPVKWSSGVCDL